MELEAVSRPIYLIGAGVVGRSILQAHLAASVPAHLSDLDDTALQRSIDECREFFPDVHAAWQRPLGKTIPTVYFQVPGSASTGQPSDSGPPPIAIESVVERRDVKQDLLRDLQSWLGPNATLCSNTSTLQISGLSERMRDPERCCGMHFFMPVERRPLVEIVVPSTASPTAIDDASEHAARLHKPTLRVADAPGFVVNRMLAPYLNESMRMLQRGASPSAIERAANEFGMPMSPFELIDLIGARTAFDAGRVYWQAFSSRIDPTAILPAMIKAKRTGRAVGDGFFHYDSPSAKRPADLAPETRAIIEEYSGEPRRWMPAEIVHRLAIPMLIEAAAVLSDRVVNSRDSIELAMRGGLGFQGEGGFFAAFDSIGRESILKTWRERHPTDRALSGGESLMQAIECSNSIAEAIESFSQEVKQHNG